MEANLKKFQAMFLGTEQNDIMLELCDQKIVSESSVKLLGVNVNNTLNLGTHIRGICANASKLLNVITILGQFLNESTNLALYQCFVLCHFSYCSIIWHHCGKSQTRKLERLQERALRCVFID